MTAQPTAERDETERQRLVAAICAAGERLELDVPVEPCPFLRHYYAQAEVEEISREPATLAAAALGHLAWARRRKPGTALVRVFNPTLERDGWLSEHTIVETANDDMPFLVDSLAMTLARLGHTIHVTIHPLLQIQRAANGELDGIAYARGADEHRTESFIHIEIVRETDAGRLAATESAVLATLRDVRAAVEDWGPMLALMREAAADLRATPGLDQDLKAESGAFLEWLGRDHFTLLGYREYDLIEGKDFDELVPRPNTARGLLRADGGEPARLTGNARAEARSSNPLVITKSRKRSTVHRPVFLDHIGIKVFDDRGHPRAERRFLGLFTSTAYFQTPRTIPLLRHKIRLLMEQSGL